jgi:hypothetical protein
MADLSRSSVQQSRRWLTVSACVLKLQRFPRGAQPFENNVVRNRMLGCHFPSALAVRGAPAGPATDNKRKSADQAKVFSGN